MTSGSRTEKAKVLLDKAERSLEKDLEASDVKESDAPVISEKDGKKNIRVLSAAACLNDLGEEMGRPYLPTFAVLFLKADPFIFALLISLEELVNRLVRPLGGILSDRYGRKPPIGGGYMTIAAYRTGISLSRVWYWLVPFISLRQVGRAIRNQSREAMVTESVPRSKRGRAFGYINAFDTVGAIIGPLVGISLLSFLIFGYFEPYGNYGSISAFRILFLVAAMPTIFSGVIIFTFLKETRTVQGRVKRRSVYADLRKGIKAYVKQKKLKVYTVANCLFATGAVPMMMILTFVQLGGIEEVNLFTVAMLFTAYNIVHALASYPAGIITDKWGRRSAQLTTDFFAVVTMVSFMFATTPWLALPGFILFGIFEALWVTSRRAVVSDLAPKEVRAQAFGIFSLFYGLSSFVAPILFALIWMFVSSKIAFLVSASIVMISAIFLALTVKK